MILFYDTETSGLPDDRRPNDLDAQPHILQLAFSLYDEARRPVFEMSTLVVLPNQAVIHEKALETHRITAELTAEYGLHPSSALRLLRFAASRAQLCVAHNEKFDLKLLNFTALRQNQSHPLQDRKTFCTLEAATPILKLPPTPAMIKYGKGPYKAPRLSECYNFFFNEELSGAHDALVDTRGCARVFYHMLDTGLIPDPLA